MDQHFDGIPYILAHDRVIDSRNIRLTRVERVVLRRRKTNVDPTAGHSFELAEFGVHGRQKQLLVGVLAHGERHVGAALGRHLDLEHAEEGQLVLVLLDVDGEVVDGRCLFGQHREHQVAVFVQAHRDFVVVREEEQVLHGFVVDEVGDLDFDMALLGFVVSVDFVDVDAREGVDVYCEGLHYCCFFQEAYLDVASCNLF